MFDKIKKIFKKKPKVEKEKRTYEKAIDHSNDITFENAKTLGEIIEVIDGPILLHCGSSNRVGALLALGKSLAGADNDTALQYGQENGLTSLEGLVRKILDAEND